MSSFWRLLTVAIPAAATYSTLNDGNFYVTVNLWFTNQVYVEATFGPISDWNVSEVRPYSDSAFRLPLVMNVLRPFSSPLVFFR